MHSFFSIKIEQCLNVFISIILTFLFSSQSQKEGAVPDSVMEYIIFKSMIDQGK